jgi:hypothetical protein
MIHKDLMIEDFMNAETEYGFSAATVAEVLDTNFDKLQSDVLAVYLSNRAWFNSMEWERAPSGEFAEYNHQKLAAEAALEACKEMLTVLGITIPDEDEG